MAPKSGNGSDHHHPTNPAAADGNASEDSASTSATAPSSCNDDRKGQTTTREMLSLWLLPPEPHRSALQCEINSIAASSGGKCPTFVPHVTILGGMRRPASIEPTDWADDLLDRLREQLGQSGPIPCRFGRSKGRRPQCEMEADGLTVKWNQSCVSVMDSTTEFVRAVELAHVSFAAAARRSISVSKDDVTVQEGTFDWTTSLRPPLCKPHYSHAYGNGPELLLRGDDDGNGLRITVPHDFDAVEAMLIWTYPTRTDCVEGWREVGRFNLC